MSDPERAAGSGARADRRAASQARTDSFEAAHMVGEDAVQHRDKRVSRGMAAILVMPALLCWFVAGLIGYGNATASKPLPGAALPFVVAAVAALGLLFLLLSVTFAVLRTVVTEREVVVKYGLWGPRIPLDRITACRVVDYEWTKFGGFGIRAGRGGTWAYVPGPGPVVELEYRDGAKRRTVQVGAQNATLLAAEINRARERVARELRIASDEGSDRDVDDEGALLEAAQTDGDGAAEGEADDARRDRER